MKQLIDFVNMSMCVIEVETRTIYTGKVSALHLIGENDFALKLDLYLDRIEKFSVTFNISRAIIREKEPIILNRSNPALNTKSSYILFTDVNKALDCLFNICNKERKE